MPMITDINGLIEDIGVARPAPIISIDEKKLIPPIPQDKIPPKPSIKLTFFVI